MFVDKENYFEIEEFKKFGVKAIYTTKNMKDEIINSIQNKGFKMVYAKQSHTKNVVDIDKNTNIYYYEDIDGFITKRKDVALMTSYADCLPIYFYDMKNDVIGISYSGWKGTYQEIGIETLKLMERNYNSKKENILIGLGIGISFEKYEVDKDFYDKFKEKFDDNIIEKCFKYYKEKNKYHFNNIEFNKLNLIKYGIKEKNIIISDECTYTNERFHSFRRDKSNNRNRGIIFFEGR